MKRKRSKTSLAEKLIKVINKEPRSAEELRRDLKDRFGYNEKPEDIRVNLLYLLRRERIKRKKSEKIYKYHI
ncbi:hypothetical protein DRH29_00065 [candidate division Kazan bacterium]|uniref:Uncharacterized protein n=1 Tax=candidate division Kazan bacterium TaxID=2202143 RepID=A0A420ZDY2_UNCK3|nr:MAG: hypothetical protein DRH29_00065 [candidate division Kazan bacterium]